MKSLLGLFALLVPIVFVSAYTVSVTDISGPYENVILGAYAGEREVHLGNIEQYPVMYEFTIEGEQSFSMRLRQAYRQGVEPEQLALLLVGVENAGASVYEVGRVWPTADDWQMVKDTDLGMHFYETETFATELATGTYRVEVSSPAGEGRYALHFGDVAGDAGYFGTLGNIRTTQKHFGYSVFRMLASPYVFYPIGILLLLAVLRKTWKYRKLISNVD